MVTDLPVELDRQFSRWTNEQNEGRKVLHGSSLGWSDLRAHRRVVLLAEAGSGKSTEIKDQAQRIAREDRYSFVTTLQNIGQKDFERALGRSKWSRFQEWRESGELAWIFLDSVDEAKKADCHFDDVLAEVAEAIDGAEGRAHLVITGRYSDWESKRDLDTLLKRVPLPPPDASLGAISPNEMLAAILNQKKREALPPEEQPLVVIMEELDHDRVKKFAKAKGVVNAESFFESLEKQNLWRFARRPTDLGWLVEYWHANHRFGTLSEMLKCSIVERLRETDPKRARKDSLNRENAQLALQRVGAALVLQRLDTIRVPDDSLDLSDSTLALDLAEVLPDWPPAELAEFITRPIFDPASAGFVCLHNDNQGEVRGYLTAKWLEYLCKANCPWPRVRDLLFADTYGVPLVKPSMRSTAAWLALWDQDVAREIERRNPRLLMDSGDPGSLALETRVAALEALIGRLTDDDLLAIPDHDALQRFAKPDIAPYIAEWWKTKKNSLAIRKLLLLMIHLGGIEECAPIATEAGFGAFEDRDTQILSGRALATVGSAEEKHRYVAYLIENANTIPAILVWDALDRLFPVHVRLKEMLTLWDRVRTDKGEAGLGYYGPTLVERISSRSDVAAVLKALLTRLKMRTESDDIGENTGDEKFLDTLEAAGRRLLDLHNDAEDIPGCVIDAALHICEARRFRSFAQKRGRQDIGDLLRLRLLTPEKRCTVFWHAVEALRAQGRSKEVSNAILQYFGFDLGLGSQDLPWLLRDMTASDDPLNICFAMNTALCIWKQDGEAAELLKQIEAAAASSPEALADFNGGRARSQEIEKWEQQHRCDEQKSAIGEAKQHQSWIAFIENLQENPNQLREIAAPTKEGVDGRLYGLWQLLDNLRNNRTRYAIRDLSPLKPLVGEAVVAALRDAFIAYWRQWKPTMACERLPEEQNNDPTFDLIGIVGVTQEAEGNPGWANRLSPDEAERAIQYATLELNGFPKWLDDLVAVHLTIASNVLWRYAQADLHLDNKGNSRSALTMLANATKPVVATVAERMVAFLEEQAELPLPLLEPAIRIATRGLAGQERTRLRSLAFSRFHNSTHPRVRAAYLSAVYADDPAVATDALMELLPTISENQQTELVQTALPTIVKAIQACENAMPTAKLEQLVVLAFAKIRPDEDNTHPIGESYSPNERDYVEDARNALFHAFVKTPGPETFSAIKRLCDAKDFPIPVRQLRECARQRASADSETEPWHSQDVRGFEQDFDSVPRTSKALQRVGVSRLEALQDELVNGDFNQGLTVAGLPNEVAVQNWFADKLRCRQGRSYSVERESPVAGEKKPDIRLRSGDALCPIEIKIAESWNLKQLENALTNQLAGQYLRDPNNHFGILLVVHQKNRPKGWESPCDGYLTFDETIKHLNTLAQDMAADASARRPQIAVCGVDVSQIAPSKKAAAPQEKQ